ncbi:MAG: MaoC family dehydratase N-terminal domain-containing protein [Dehalococcoidia bacterium]
MADEVMELTPEMKEAIGKSGEPTMYEVTSLGIRTFCRAVGYEDGIYFDDDEAKKAGHPAIIAPPGYLGMPVWNPNAPARRQDFFKSPFTRNLNGGTAVEPLAHVYAGDLLEAVTTLTSLEILPSKAYGQLMVRKSETVYTRKSDGKVVAKTRGTGLSY